MPAAAPRADAVRLALRTLLILFVGSAAGLVYNGLSGAGIPLRTPDQPGLEDLLNWNLHVEGLRVTAREAKEAFDRGDAVFLDARTPEDYFAGHIPGARNLPAADFETRAEEILKGLPGDALLITYCSGERCQSSILLARRLIEKRGHTRTRVFFDGWRAWDGAGYPIAIGVKP